MVPSPMGASTPTVPPPCPGASREGRRCVSSRVRLGAPRSAHSHAVRFRPHMPKSLAQYRSSSADVMALYWRFRLWMRVMTAPRSGWPLTPMRGKMRNVRCHLYRHANQVISSS
jgi:hypothetical protein